MRKDDSSQPAPVDYIDRVNRAIDHIVSHLDQPVSLDDVAAVASFSPYHFHRIFRSLVGEPMGQFVKRVRLERSLYLMSHDPDRSLTDVAMSCGFASSSDFSRSFKQRYGVPPSVFDLKTWRSNNRNALNAAVLDSGSPHHLDRLPPGENPDGFEVTLRELPARTVAYIRVLEPYTTNGVPDAIGRLLAWAEERSLADGQWLGYMWEDPEIVALDKCRYDVALEIDPAMYAFESSGEIGRYRFPPMQVAQVEIRGGLDLVQRALDWLFTTWLPASRYVPDDQPCFEAWIGRPMAHGMEHFELFSQLPVKRAST